MANDSFEDLKRKMLGSGAFDSMKELTATAMPVAPAIPSIISETTNPARWMFKRLGEYIKDFEAELNEEHEIGARLVSFGQAVTFHIQNLGYYGPDIISFDGANEGGEKVQLIQHISQLSVLLIAMKKLEDKPRRIGFIWDKEQNDDDKNA